jgi:hypothetical protein
MKTGASVTSQVVQFNHHPPLFPTPLSDTDKSDETLSPAQPESIFAKAGHIDRNGHYHSPDGGIWEPIERGWRRINLPRPYQQAIYERNSRC